MAISLYKQGIQELERGVNLSVDPNGKKKTLKWISSYLIIWIIDNRAVELHAKMRRNLNMARERVEALRKFMISFYTNFDHFFCRNIN